MLLLQNENSAVSDVAQQTYNPAVDDGKNNANSENAPPMLAMMPKSDACLATTCDSSDDSDESIITVRMIKPKTTTKAANSVVEFCEESANGDDASSALMMVPALTSDNDADDKNNAPGASTKGMDEEWRNLATKIQEAYAMRRALRELEDFTQEWTENFIERNGAAGFALAGTHQQNLQDLRDANEVAHNFWKNERKRRAEKQRLLKERRDAEEKLRAFQEKTRREGRQIQRELDEATTKLKSYSTDERESARSTTQRQLKCRVCGLEGVPRGKDCPAIATHYMYKKWEF